MYAKSIRPSVKRAQTCARRECACEAGRFFYLNLNSFKIEISFLHFSQNLDFPHSWFSHKRDDIIYCYAASKWDIVILL